MQNLLRHFIFIFAVIAVAVLLIYPPETRLRLSKDLNGGATLVYQVELKANEGKDTMDKMIELLKRRVDPQGVLEITMTQLGENRIEITMPLPNDRVRAMRKAYLDELAKLGEAPDSVGRLEGALKLDPAARDAELVKIAGSDTARLALLKKVAEAADTRARLTPAYDAAERTAQQLKATAASAAPEAKAAADAAYGAAQADLEARARALVEVELGQETIVRQLGASGASPTEVAKALELANQSKGYTDPETGKRESIPSPRQRALDAIRARNPGAVEQINAVIAKYDAFQEKRSTLDDPADLKRILRGAGVLTFRIAVRPGAVVDEDRLRTELRAGGAKAVRSSEVRWFKVNKEDGWFHDNRDAAALGADATGYFKSRYNMVADRGPDGALYLLLYDLPGKRLTPQDSQWGLASAYQDRDQQGRPNIAFKMDDLGAREMGNLTGANLEQPMAVLLDDEVYTAPNINSRIGQSGQIMGDFSTSEIQYVVRVLSAGSMAAKLSPEPVSESTIGPELGKDNLSRGLWAGVISFVLISAFMIAYYFSGGMVATIALAINLLLLLALMALMRAAFSLPGIAGIVLAFGMAVDANVLIYERLREELAKGEPLRLAIRVAYARALAPILDGNLTHLITCVVLGFFGTPEIRGFAITMSIGVLTTLFCQLYITRVIYYWLIDKVRIKRVTMLPLVWPWLQRAMTLRTDWMRLCPIFFTLSALLVAGSLVAVVGRGSELLDTVFRGGTRVTVQLKRDEATGAPMLAKRDEVQERIKRVVAADSTGVLRDLADPQILIIDPDTQNRSNRFVIQTTIQDSAAVSEALRKSFEGLLDQAVPLKFTGMDAALPDATATTLAGAPVYPILSPDLGDLLKRPGVKLDISDYMGGAVLVMDDLGPVHPTLAALEDRFRTMRSDRAFVEAQGRKSQLVVLQGSPASVESAALLVRDDSINFMKDSESQARWTNELKPSELKLAREALNREATFAAVERFDSTIARKFVSQAISAVVLSTIAIIIFVWVRFNSLRYSLAAIIATLHDCIVAVGAIAIAELLYKAAPGFCGTIGLLPFKIDLNVIAAVLTILGYSLNDKIVIMDRIRENRGKLPYATRSLINDSINQTISRTIMTGTTVFIASLVLYIVGGEALRAFAYSFIVGVVTGTYSSIAVAAPIVWSRKLDPTVQRTEPFGITPAAA
ncbi:hypothetical protein BH11PLA1_BH11PLA1_07340 [soil metagenome]